MSKTPSVGKRKWNRQVNRHLETLDAMRGWLEKTFPPGSKLQWSEVVSLERANHYLGLAALQLSLLRQARRQIARPSSLNPGHR